MKSIFSFGKSKKKPARRPAPANSFQARRSFLEQLEPRHLMASVPVAFDDARYTTPTSTSLVISSTGSGVLSNDVDADSGTTLTASLVANPSHGTLTLNSNGTFTYTPTAGYTGFDAFTYKANDGSLDSNVSTVSIAVGGVFGPRTNLDSNPLDAMNATGCLVVNQDLSQGQGLNYRSDSYSRPVVEIETSLIAGSTVPNSITAQLTFGGITGSAITYSTSGLSAGAALRFALQVDATSLSTGYYDYTVTLTANYTGSTQTSTFTGSQAIINRTSSEFGGGWWLNGLDRLVTSSAGALLVKGSGDTLWFASNGSGGYLHAVGDTSFGTLVKNGDNTFTLTSIHGAVQNFSTIGLLTSNVDTNGNTYTFAYTDADGDSVSDELSTITDPFSRTTTLSYTSGKVTSVQDTAGRTTTLGYTSGKLTSATQPDPDGAGSLASPVWGMTYDSTTGQLSSHIDPLSHATSFSYNSNSRRLSQITFADSTTWTLTPVQTIGLPSGTSGQTLSSPSAAVGQYVDGLGKTWTFKTNRFGQVTVATDPLGNVTTTDYNADGQVIKLTQADPDGSGAQTSPITKYGYNSSGDQVTLYNPDLTSKSWTYSTGLHLPLTATDEMGRVVTMTYDSYGNMLTQQDPAGNTTTYTYTSRGLVASIQTPDPDGAGSLTASTTSFTYDSYGRQTVQTNPDSTTIQFGYNSADQVTTVTDELSSVTTIAYDNLNRKTSVTSQDPDGSGALTASVTSWVYNAIGLITKETDALGNDTDYTYNSRNWVSQVDYPDPDGSGPLARPYSTSTYRADGQLATTGDYSTNLTQITYSYNDAGWRTNQKSVFGSTDYISYTYDNLGRVLTKSEPYAAGGNYTVTTYAYNNRGWVTSVTGQDPDGIGSQQAPVTGYGYNYAGQKTSETDPLGNVTTIYYNSRGDVGSVAYSDPDGSGPLYSPTTTYGYDNLGRKISETDSLGNITTYVYNSRNWLTSVTKPDPDGSGSLSAPVTSTGYNNAGWQTSVTDPLGNVTTLGYDNLGRVISVTHPDPDGSGALAAPVEYYAYNKMGKVTSHTDALGNVTTTAYDNVQHVTSVTNPDPDGAGSLSAPVTTYTYNSQGLVSKVTDALGHETTLGYNNNGQKTSETDYQGHVTSFTYDYLGNLLTTTATDPDGSGSLTAPVTTNAYDYARRLTSTTNPASGVTTYTYDTAGKLLTLKDPVNNTTSYAYDNLGRKIMETNALSAVRSYGYDANGNLVQKTDALGRVTVYQADNLGRTTAEQWYASSSSAPAVTVSTTTNGGAVNEVQRVGFTVPMSPISGTFTLSFGGQTTSSISGTASAATVQSALEGLSSVGSGNVTVTKTTDTSSSQVWTVTFQGSLAGSNVSQITINTSGIYVFFGTVTKTEVTDTQGQSAQNEVQVVTLTNVTGGTFRLAFAGQVTAPIAYNASATDVKNALAALQVLDASDLSVTGSSGGPYTITFQGTYAGLNLAPLFGDAINLTNSSVVQTISTAYDANDQVTSASDASSSYTFTYDNLGRATAQTVNLTGLTPQVSFTNVFDTGSRQTSQAVTIGSTADLKNEWTYDNLSRLTRVTQQGQSGGNTVQAKRADFTYNAVGQTTGIDRFQNTAGTNSVVQTAYTYNSIGLLTDIDHTQGSTVLASYDLSYDAMSRLTSRSHSVDGTSTFTYDSTSQLTAADNPGSITDESYSYNANGSRNSTGYTTGTNNLTTSDGTYNYTYDAEGNRTKRTKISDGSYTDYTWDHRNRLTKITDKTSTGTVTKVIEQSYDVMDRWVRRNTDPDGAGSAGSRDTFFVYDGSNINPLLQFDGTSASSLSHRYLWSDAVDQILADEQVTSLSSAGNTLWGLGDNLGSIRDVADQNESTYTTTITNHRVYDGYGKLTSESNSSVDLLFGFTGKPLDDDSGLQNNLHRWYDAAIGQWLSEDPIGFEAGDSNIRRYVNNRPLHGLDSTGLDESPSLAIAGPLIGGGLGEWGQTPPYEFLKPLKGIPELSLYQGNKPSGPTAGLKGTLNPGDDPDDGGVTGDIGIGFGGVSAGLHNNWFDGNYDGGDFDVQFKAVGSFFGTFVPGDLSLFYKMYGSGNKVNGYEILADAKTWNAKLGIEGGQLYGGGELKKPDVGSINYSYSNGTSLVGAKTDIELPSGVGGGRYGGLLGDPARMSIELKGGPNYVGAFVDVFVNSGGDTVPTAGIGGSLTRGHGDEGNEARLYIWKNR